MLVPGTNHSIFHYHMPAVCLERATIISDQSHIILRSIITLITLLIMFSLFGCCCSRIILLYYVPVIHSNILLFPLYPICVPVIRSRITWFPYYIVILRSILRIILRCGFVPVIVPVIVRIYLVVLLSNIT